MPSCLLAWLHFGPYIKANGSAVFIRRSARTCVCSRRRLSVASPFGNERNFAFLVEWEGMDEVSDARSGLGWNAKSSWLLDRHPSKVKPKRSVGKQKGAGQNGGANMRFKWSILRVRMTTGLPGCHKWLRKWSPHGGLRHRNQPTASAEEPAIAVSVRSSYQPPPKPPRLPPCPPGENEQKWDGGKSTFCFIHSQKFRLTGLSRRWFIDDSSTISRWPWRIVRPSRRRWTAFSTLRDGPPGGVGRLEQEQRHLSGRWRHPTVRGGQSFMAPMAFSG